MKTYKLGKISIIKNGITPSTKNKNFWKKEIPFFQPSNLNIGITKRFITKQKKWLKRKGTTLISSTATIGKIGILKQESWFNQQITSIEPNNNFLLDQYLYYYFFNKKKELEIKGTGSIFKLISINVFRNWKINFPLIKEQQKIIDIIEPIENKLNIIKKIINILENIIWKFPLYKTDEINFFGSIKTGKLNNNVIKKNGKYNFYSCSKSIKKSDKNSFKGRYMLVSGNGEIYSWWEDNEFDLYQRVYALKEKKDFFTSLFSLEKGLKKLRKNSNGAVIKFIKIKNLKNLNKYENKYEKNLEFLYKFKKNLEKEFLISNKLKEEIIKILII